MRYTIILLTNICDLYIIIRVIYVKYAHYEFDKISNCKESKYIFQYVSDRKLTNIYHSHNFFEACIVLSGTAIECFNGEKRVLREGAVTIIKPDEPHCFLDQSEEIKLVCLSVEKTEALRLFEAFDVSIPKKDIIFQTNNAISTAAGMINTSASERHYKLFFGQIISLLSDNQNKAVPYVLQSAVQQMHRVENMQLGISKFVELSGYSRSHLTRLIRQYYNCSLHELITQLRLESAYKEIILSKDALEDIAYKVGYSSFSHFQKVFKKAFGVTAATLRKTNAAWTV